MNTEKNYSPLLAINWGVANILYLEASNWLLSNEEILIYNKNLQKHVAKILVKSFAALKHFEKVLPKYIPHKFIEITKQKTVFFNVELINASENSNEGIIVYCKKYTTLFCPIVL